MLRVAQKDTECALLVSKVPSGPFIEAPMYTSGGQVYVEASAGSFYHIRLRNLSAAKKAVAVWVDTEKVSSECAWLEPRETLTLKGFPRSAVTKFADVVPFSFGELRVVSSPSASAASGDVLGSIKIAVYGVVSTTPYTVEAYVPASERGADKDVGVVASDKIALQYGVAASRPSVAQVDGTRVTVETEFKLRTDAVELFHLRYRDRAALLLAGVIDKPTEADKAVLAGTKRAREREGATDAPLKSAAMELVDLTEDVEPSAAKVIPLAKLRVCCNDGAFRLLDVHVPKVGPAPAPASNTAYDWASLADFVQECRKRLEVAQVRQVWDADGVEQHTLSDVLTCRVLVVGVTDSEEFIPAMDAATQAA